MAMKLPDRIRRVVGPRIAACGRCRYWTVMVFHEHFEHGITVWED